jgi:HD-GYP domain-containing protein (c-di-GMP phosphodiesterase class II)
MPNRTRYPIRVHIAAAFSLLLIIVGTVMVWLAYQKTSSILSASTTELTQRAALKAAVGLDRILRPTRTAIRLMAVDEQLTSARIESHLRALPKYVEALKTAPAVVALYFGSQSGTYFLTRRILDEADRRLFGAPAATAFLVQSIDRARVPAVSLYIFYDEDLREIGRIDAPQALVFDPRQRPWYTLAHDRAGTVLTPPYVFFSSQKVGISVATRAADGGVFGADLRLETLSDLLARQRMTPSARLFMMDSQRRLLASDVADITNDTFGKELLRQLAALDPSTANQARLRHSQIASHDWYLENVRVNFDEDEDVLLGVAVPESEMLADAREVRSHMILAIIALLLLSIPAAIWLARQIARPLHTLAKNAEAMRGFDLDKPIDVDSFILEVHELATTLGQAKSTLARFLDIVAHLGNEQDFNRLMPELLRATTETAQTDGGLLYLLTEDAKELRPMAGRWDGKELDLAGVDSIEDIFSCRTTLDMARTVVAKVTPAESIRFGGDAKDSVSVPLYTRQHQPVGVLVLINRRPIDPLRIRFIEALSGFAAVALETRELIATQKALFESFIKMMAAAIDAKSPYTGGHCARVPEAVKLLAEAACAQAEGPYADFEMSPEQWEALHIAAWLHDCGKVTTPEYVVDKATKLETLYDRIHEVRMRFEVLKRDAEIAHLRAVASGADPRTSEAERDSRLSQLDDDYAFVAECNLGGEFMAPERVERLERIAARNWLRTLDDRLGVSNDERRRMAGRQEAALPVEEPLLSDRPEHCIARLDGNRFGQGNPWGFAMKAPELLYDRGELKNLRIARGTLADEERYKINEHIIQTIVMLTSLPFPKHLADVPEIAGAHHERMDGKGYPRGLKGEAMSPLARMMAIADVFEALTACDRPYKSAKNLSQSLGIMKRMAEEGHLDKELFRIFIQSGVCLRYAEQFLTDSQRDTTDLSAYLPTA